MRIKLKRASVRNSENLYIICLGEEGSVSYLSIFLKIQKQDDCHRTCINNMIT